MLGIEERPGEALYETEREVEISIIIIIIIIIIILLVCPFDQTVYVYTRIHCREWDV